MKSSLIFLLLFAANIAFAQLGKFYSTDKAISNSLINCIFQDSKGYIWIATEDGLNLFDGNRFTEFKNNPNDSLSIGNNFVNVIKEDSQKRMWIGLVNSLMLYDRESNTFHKTTVRNTRKGENEPSFLTPQVSHICERRNGDILVATSGRGVLILSRDSSVIYTYEELNRLLPSSTITYLYEDSYGHIWIATENKGLCVYLPETKDVTIFKAPETFKSNEITCVNEDASGNIFIGTLTSGLYRYDPQRRIFVNISYYKSNIPLRIKSICKTHADEILIGTDGQGIKKYNPQQDKIEDYHILSSDFNFTKAKVHVILEDRDNNLWLGIFQKGVQFIPWSNTKFTNYGYLSNENNNIGSNCVNSIYFEKEHNALWVGTDNDGLYCIKDNTSSKHYPLAANGIYNTIMAIAPKSPNHLWLCSYIDGLHDFDTQTGTSRKAAEIFGKYSNIPDQKVTCITTDKQGYIYVGTYGFDIFRFRPDGSDLCHFSQKGNSASSRWINCAICDYKGVLWFGTYLGLTAFNPYTNEWKYYTLANSNIPDNIIFAITEDKQHNLWIGSTKGLSRFNPKSESFENYSTLDGLPNNVICNICEDKNNNIWVSTHYGISQFIPTTRSFINYYSFDGLQSNEFYHGAGFKTNDGKIYFGGIKGISSFYPEEISIENKRLDVIITHLYLAEKKVYKGSVSDKNQIMETGVEDATHFTFAGKENVFSLEFSTMQYDNPERVIYEYQLQNISNKWIATEPGNNRITFTNLSHGHYTLLYRAKINNCISPTKQIFITITPPWYLSTEAYIIWFSIIALIILFFVSFVLSQIKSHNNERELKKQEEIQEAKLQFFINISHEIRTPMTLIINPLEKLIKKDTDDFRLATYNVIHRNSIRILQLINQLLDIRKIDKGQMLLKFKQTSLIPFINDILENFRSLAENKHINLQYIYPNESILGWIDNHNFDKIIINLLSNAFKFTPNNGNIRLEIKTGSDENRKDALKNYISITVTDSGIGINKDNLEKIFERFYQGSNDIVTAQPGTGVGLHLSRSLAILHHGILFAENRTDTQGSQFTLLIPQGSAHLTTEELTIDTEEIASQLKSINNNEKIVTDEDAALFTKSYTRSNYKILIVDDESEIRNYVSAELSPYFRITEASNGQEAFELALKETPHLIISDVMMPQMDGFSLCHKIKQNINLNHIPVVLLTARSNQEDTIEGLEYGADAYLSKPFNIDILRRTITNLIENRERIRTKYSNSEQEKKLNKVTLKSIDEQFMDRVMKVINENIANPNFTVELLADNIGVSRVHLHRKLKELTGSPTRDFIRNIRLKKAAELLSTQNVGISEVAYAVGFSNLSHFSSVFKDVFGVTPRSYNESSQNNEI